MRWAGRKNCTGRSATPGYDQGNRRGRKLQDIILAVLEEEGKERFIPLSDKIRLSRELFNSFRRLDILQDLLEDDAITEIMVNGTEHIFYEKGGRLYRSERRFASEERLNDVIPADRRGSQPLCQ